MTSFLIDPFVATVPCEGTAEADVIEWLRALEQWNSELEHSAFDWRHVQKASCNLASQDCLATTERLRRLFRDYRIDKNPWSFRPVSNFFLDEDRDYLSKMYTTDATGEVQSPEIEPYDIIARNRTEVRPAVEKALLSLAVDKLHEKEFASSVRIVTAQMDEDTKNVSISVKGVIVEQQGALRGLPELKVDERFEVLTAPDDLIAIQPKEALSISIDEFIRWATRYAVTILACEAPLVLSCHPRFERSVVDSNLRSDSIGLEKAARIAAQLISGKVTPGLKKKPFTVNASSDSPQRVRKSDGAHAWRVRITDDGVGWRLNYWHLHADPRQSIGKIEKIELAWVEAKSAHPYIPD